MIAQHLAMIAGVGDAGDPRADRGVDRGLDVLVQPHVDLVLADGLDRGRDLDLAAVELRAAGGPAAPRRVSLGRVRGRCERRQPMSSNTLKIGMYRAMIIDPTMPPRKAIMSGSMSAVSASVVASTSSS